MKILICGAGAIGSNLTARLVADLKGKHEITVVDYDKIETRNVTAGTQFYTTDQVGLAKVEALQFNIYKWFEREISFLNYELTDGNVSLLNKFDLIIDCFDNYVGRRLVQVEAARSRKPLIHVGFSDSFTFSIEWNDNYNAPTNITSDMDICEMQGAGAFVNYVASICSLAIEEFISYNKKIEIIGGKYHHRIL